jgi:hypothetical protein
MYAFGHGLSYTTFAYKDLKVSGGETITATFTVTNTGKVAGADVPQVYLTDAPDGRRMRLLGFERVDLQPVQCRFISGRARQVGRQARSEGERAADAERVRTIARNDRTTANRTRQRRQVRTTATRRSATRQVHASGLVEDFCREYVWELTRRGC